MYSQKIEREIERNKNFICISLQIHVIANVLIAENIIWKFGRYNQEFRLADLLYIYPCKSLRMNLLQILYLDALAGKIGRDVRLVLNSESMVGASACIVSDHSMPVDL